MKLGDQTSVLHVILEILKKWKARLISSFHLRAIASSDIFLVLVIIILAYQFLFTIFYHFLPSISCDSLLRVSR